MNFSAHSPYRVPQYYRSTLLFTSLLMLFMLACGRSVAPVPITNPGGIETALAGTAHALAQQTEIVQGYTTTPSVIPTRMTPTLRIASAGTSLEILEDGSTRFTDHTAGIQVVFPAGWLTVRAGELEFYQAWEKEAANNSVLQDVFTSMQNSDPDQFRVTAVETSSAVTHLTVSKMDIVFGLNDERLLDEVRIDQTNRPRALAEFKLLSSSLAKTADGLEVAIVDFQWKSASPENEIFLSYHRDVIFKVPSGTVALQLSTGVSEKDKVMPAFEQVINSVTLIDP